MKYLRRIMTGLTFAAIFGSASGMEKAFSNIKPFKLVVSKEYENLICIEDAKKAVEKTLFMTMKIDIKQETLSFILQRNNLSPYCQSKIFITPSKKSLRVRNTQLPFYFLCEALSFIENINEKFDFIENETKVIQYGLSRSLFAAINILASFTGHARLSTREKEVIKKHKQLFDKKTYDSRGNYNKTSAKEVSENFNCLLSSIEKLYRPLVSIFKGCNRFNKVSEEITKAVMSTYFPLIDKNAFFKKYESFTKK